MQKLKLKTEKIAEINNFAQKNSMFFVLQKDTVFFINRLKLEAVLSFLCLLSEFNEKFGGTEYGNITQWLRSKKLLMPELLSEISLFVSSFSEKNIF